MFLYTDFVTSKKIFFFIIYKIFFQIFEHGHLSSENLDDFRNSKLMAREFWNTLTAYNID